jgi:hypothetical protein
VFGVEKEKEFKGEFIVEFKIALVNVWLVKQDLVSLRWHFADYKRGACMTLDMLLFVNKKW